MNSMSGRWPETSFEAISLQLNDHTDCGRGPPAVFDEKLAKLGYHANSGKSRRSHHKKGAPGASRRLTFANVGGRFLTRRERCACLLLHRCGEMRLREKHRYMKTKKRARPSGRPESKSSVRATISFPSGQYETLEEIARQKKVSLAWVVREATEEYLTNKWPLLFAKDGEARK